MPERLAAAQLISRPRSAGEAVAACSFAPPGQNFNVTLHIPRLDVTGSHANGTLPSQGHRLPFGGFWPMPPAPQQQAAAVDSYSAALMLPQWSQQQTAANGQHLMQPQLHSWQSAPPSQHAAAVQRSGAQSMLSSNWQMADRLQPSLAPPGGGPGPPRHWAGAAAFGAFPPVPQPSIAPSMHPLGAPSAAVRAQEAAVASSEYAQVSSNNRVQLEHRPQQPSADGGIWRERRPEPSTFSGGSRSKIPSGGIPAAMERPRPDTQWLQSLPSLKDMLQRNIGEKRAVDAGQPLGQGSNAQLNATMQQHSGIHSGLGSLASHGVCFHMIFVLDTQTEEWQQTLQNVTAKKLNKAPGSRTEVMPWTET